MIAVIDYKAGNLTSVVKALRYLGANDVVVTQSPEDVLRADKIVLPGVGHFQATQLLHDLHLTEATREAARNGAPFLGICVGLQWLYGGSTESPETEGLGHVCGCSASGSPRYVMKGRGAEVAARGMELAGEYSGDSRLLAGIAPGSFVYYTHSWRAPVSADTAATTEYGGPFTAAVERENVMGVQFHPEKSAEAGLRVLNNFLEL